jgi:uncharacterized protein
MNVLYFHGFASSPRSRKVESLARLLAPEITLDAPDLNVPSFEKLDFEAMVRLGLERAMVNPPRAIVGSSLGAVIALEVARRGVHAPMVLIAPGLGIGNRWTSRLEAGDPVMVFNHARNERAPIHRAFFEGMNAIENDGEPPPVAVTIFMGTKDETVPFTLVHEVWQAWEQSGKLVKGSKFIEIPEGDHGLVAYVDRIAGEIRAAAHGR